MWLRLTPEKKNMATQWLLYNFAYVDSELAHGKE